MEKVHNFVKMQKESEKRFSLKKKNITFGVFVLFILY
jgi:hypothetical protein